jgi:hypothetical protein
LPTITLYATVLFPIIPTCLTYMSHLHVSPTCLTYLIVLDLVTWIIFSEQCRSWSSSICSFLHPPVTSSFLDPNIFLKPKYIPQHPILEFPWPVFIQCDRPGFTPIQNNRQYQVVLKTKCLLFLDALRFHTSKKPNLNSANSIYIFTINFQHVIVMI